MQLVSTITKTIPTPNGDKTAKIYAELLNPLPNNLTKELTFNVRYFIKETYTSIAKKEAVIIQDENGNDIELDAGQEEVKKEREIVLFRFEETYNEEQIEALYKQIKELLTDSATFFDSINQPIEIAFEQKIRQGKYFKLEANQWEKVK